MANSQPDEFEGPVGLFWDYDSIPSLEEAGLVHLINKLREWGDRLSGGKGFDVQVLCHHSPKNTEYFQKLGFEVIDQDGDSWPALDSGVLSVTAKILLWLWDVERKTSIPAMTEKGAENTAAPQDKVLGKKEKDTEENDEESEVGSSSPELSPRRVQKPPTILFVTANDHFAPLLTTLTQRGVDVAVLSTFSSNPNTPLRCTCSMAMDIKQFMLQQSAAPRAESDKPQSPTAASPPLATSEQKLAFCETDDDSCVWPTQDVPKSPTSTEWSPTPRGLDESAPFDPRQTQGQTQAQTAVPRLNISASLRQSLHPNMADPEDMGRQQQQPNSRSQQRRAVPFNMAARLLGGDDIQMDSPRSLDGYINKDDGDSDSVLLQEQRTLHDELVSAIYMNNVKAAVATLRKMYTRQSRSFRIPALLSLIMPDTAAMLEDSQVDLFHVSIKFSLDCIQWCFGVQRGENVESFKYKMNKNIARWVLKETQRKGVSNPASQYTVNSAVALVKIVLVDTTELEFALDILTCLNVPQPLQYFVPHVNAWMKAPPAFQQHLDLKALQKFMYEHPDLQTFMHRGVPPRNGPALSLSLSGSSNGSGVNSYVAPRLPTSWDDGQGGAGAKNLNGYNNLNVGREEWIRDSSTSSQQEARQQMLYHLDEFGEASGMLGGGRGRDERQGPGHSTSGPTSSATQPLEAKLLKLLVRSAKGELGARIPALYRDEYGEPLRLRGRKLKDILLETGLVEMVGSDGPGDKLFRILGSSASGDNPRDNGPLKESPRTRSNEGSAGGRRVLTSRSSSSLDQSRDGSDSYGGGSVQQLSDRSGRSEVSDFAGDGGAVRHRPSVPSLLNGANSNYTGGLGDLLKQHEGRNSYASMPDMHGPRQQQLVQSHHHHHQQQQHRPEYSSHHDGSDLMYGSYNNHNGHVDQFSRRDDYSGNDSYKSPRDGSDYVSRLYAERGQSSSSSLASSSSASSASSSSSSSFMLFESGTGLNSLPGGRGGGASTLSELNRDSVVLAGSRGGAARV